MRLQNILYNTWWMKL